MGDHIHLFFSPGIAGKRTVTKFRSFHGETPFSSAAICAVFFIVLHFLKKPRESLGFYSLGRRVENLPAVEKMKG